MNKECLSCSHSKEKENNNYCYMFEKAPEKLPCAQHDMYKELRIATGELLIKHPALIFMMIGEIRRR